MATFHQGEYEFINQDLILSNEMIAGLSKRRPLRLSDNDKLQFPYLESLLLALKGKDSIDFSSIGLQSLNFATKLANELNADLRCMHLYPSAPHYLKNASSEREVTEALRNHSLKEWEAYKKQFKNSQHFDL